VSLEGGIAVVVFPRGTGGGVAIQLNFLSLKLVEIELLVLLCAWLGSNKRSCGAESVVPISREMLRVI